MSPATGAGGRSGVAAGSDGGGRPRGRSPSRRGGWARRARCPEAGAIWVFATSKHGSTGEVADAVAQEQFTFLQSQNLLTSKGVLIHGVSLAASDF